MPVLQNFWLACHQLLQFILISNSSAFPPPLQLGGQLNTLLLVDKTLAGALVLEPELPLLLLLAGKQVVEGSKFRGGEDPLAALAHHADRHQHQREGDSRGWVGLDEVENTQAHNLDEGEQMDPWKADILEVDIVGLVLRWHEQEKDPVKELETAQCRDAHEQEDAIEDGHGKDGEDGHHEHAEAGEYGDEEIGDTLLPGSKRLGLLTGDRGGALLLQGLHVTDGRDRVGDKPGKSEEGADEDDDGQDEQVQVVAAALLQLVVFVVDNDRGDLLVHEEEDAGQEGEQGGEDAVHPHRVGEQLVVQHQPAPIA